MGILFIETNPVPSKEKPYKLIIASNRDEYFGRESIPAAFWANSQQNIVGGIDMYPGKQGGTWFAFNKNGKFGQLLNIMLAPSDVDPNKAGRGYLVKDYVTGTYPGEKYHEHVISSKVEYNGYELITGEHVRGKGFELLWHNNRVDGDTIVQLSPGAHVFSNVPFIDGLMKKITEGKVLFEDILKSQGEKSKDQLVEELMTLLKRRQPFYPDEIFEGLAQDLGNLDLYVDEKILKDKMKFGGFFKLFTSINMHIPYMCIGTRSHTIVLVDQNDKATFIEHTLKKPPMIGASRGRNFNPWHISKYEFDMKYED